MRLAMPANVSVLASYPHRSRLLCSREAARLMGLPDSYILPRNYYEAYRFAGDGVAVPVVRQIAQSILEPILETRAISQAAE